MIDVEPVISDIERKLYEELDLQTTALNSARDQYILKRLEPEATIALADAYLIWHETLDKIARIQADRISQRLSVLNQPKFEVEDEDEDEDEDD